MDWLRGNIWTQIRHPGLLETLEMSAVIPTSNIIPGYIKKDNVCTFSSVKDSSAQRTIGD